MISVRNLGKTFGMLAAVDDISFEIPRGQIVGLLGPNGAGKTTLLRMLVGMLEPTRGTATVDGFDVRRDPIEVKKRVGFVPESGAVFESLSGLEYLEMIASLYEIPRDRAQVRIEEVTSLLGLARSTLAGRYLGSYSHGMRRKVVISAALLHDPSVLLLDEPLTGLDVESAESLATLVRGLAGAGCAVIYSSHILDVVERVSDRVIIMKDGRALVDGAPSALVEERQAQSLRQLFIELTRDSRKPNEAASRAG
jgi:ABC-2 type transport system ATP-binding protein